MITVDRRMGLMEIERIAASIGFEEYLGNVVTEAEIEECSSVVNSAERLAGKVVVKDALMKAISKGIRQGIWFTQIEVLNEESGAPYVRVHGEMESSIKELGVKTIHISVT